MMRNEFRAKDGKEISYVEWNEVQNPKCVIQVAHGMAEHAMRYDHFAKRMNQLGIVVIADDHRAHGVTDKATLGYSKGDIWNNTLSDMLEVLQYAKQKYQLPVVLFGHSYGSFLAQEFIKRHNDLLAGAVVGGSSFMKTGVGFGGFVSKIGCAFKGDDKKAVFIKKLTFDAYNKKFKEGTFISSIVEECEKYKDDPMVGFVCSYNFYKCFFAGLKNIYKKGDYNLKDFKVLLLGGDNDPVGNNGKGVLKLEAWYKEQGALVETKLYKGVRHEYLNDISREQSMNDIYEFTNYCIFK